MFSSPTKNNGRRVLALILALLMLSSTITVLAASSTDAYVNGDEVSVREGPGTGYSRVRFAGDDIYLNKGHYVRILGQETDSSGAKWYSLNFSYCGYSKAGYIRSDYVNPIGDDSAFRSYLNEQGFPDSYHPWLRALNAASGGKWTFVANHTGLDWDYVVELESTPGVSLVNGSNKALRSMSASSYNSSTGTWKEYEPGWYAASSSTVSYFLDPRTYLVDGCCLALEKLSGNENITFTQLKKVFSGYVWATDEIIQDFLKAASAANVNPVMLASRSKQELGSSATKNASGYPYAGGVYYNFFNIGAYGGSDPNLEGIKYAKSHGWDTPYKAILGGAQFIAKNYIAEGQDTLYLQRFNLTDKSSVATHQYMTNIRAPYYEGWSTYEDYGDNGLLDTSIILTVPVLDDMPDVTKLPTSQDEPEILSYNYVETMGLTLSSSYVSGFKLGTTAQSVADQIRQINSQAKVTIKNTDGTVLTSQPIGTGSTITITDPSGTMTYTCVIKGDVDGNGQIGATDLLRVKSHILGKTTLNGAAARAATLANGQIGATSLLAIKNHILRKATIPQK